MQWLLIQCCRTRLPRHANGGKGVGPFVRTVSNRSIDHQNTAFMFCPVGLNQRQSSVHGVRALIKRETCDLRFPFQADIGLPAVL